MTIARIVWLAILAAACGTSSASDPDSGPATDSDTGTDSNTGTDWDADTDSAAASRSRHADTVVSAPGATGTGTGDPNRAVNGVRGAGDAMGSLDVFSLGFEPGVDDHVVLRWSLQRVTDGPGVDVVVFENAFVVADGSHFVDAAIVEVSREGETWVPFPHDYIAPDETAYSGSPDDWLGFAGVAPVRLHEEDNPVDPFDAAAAGGDAFDLATLAAGDPEADAIRAEGFAFLRITSAHARENPDTGAPYARAPVATGPDVDGVYARWLAPE